MVTLDEVSDYLLCHFCDAIRYDGNSVSFLRPPHADHCEKNVEHLKEKLQNFNDKNHVEVLDARLSRLSKIDTNF